MSELALFASTFVLVFGIGLQSQNVVSGRYAGAFLATFLIGVAHLVLLKLGPNSTATGMAAFLLGGPFGIVASMAAHERLVRRRS